MTQKQRVEKLERAMCIDEPCFVWINDGETSEAAMANGRRDNPAGTKLILIGWEDSYAQA